LDGPVIVLNTAGEASALTLRFGLPDMPVIGVVRIVVEED
jgi:hypothetical protein